MKEYKIIKPEFHWKNNTAKFEELLNEHTQQRWDVPGFPTVGETDSSFVALRQRSKHR